MFLWGGVLLFASAARSQNEPRRQPLPGPPIVVRENPAGAAGAQALPELSLRERQLEMELQEARREIARLRALPAESADPELRKSRAERRLESALAEQDEMRREIDALKENLKEAARAMRQAEGAKGQADEQAARATEALAEQQQRAQALEAQAEEYRNQARALAREVRDLRRQAESSDGETPSPDPEAIPRLEAELAAVRGELEKQRELADRYRELAQATSAAAPRVAANGPVEDLAAQGLAAFRAGDLESARLKFEEALEGQEENAALHGYLGAVHFAEKRYKKARRSLERCVELNPLDPVGHFNLAVLLASLNNPDLVEARAHYEESVRLGGDKDGEIEKRLYP